MIIWYEKVLIGCALEMQAGEHDVRIDRLQLQIRIRRHKEEECAASRARESGRALLAMWGRDLQPPSPRTGSFPTSTSKQS